MVKTCSIALLHVEVFCFRKTLKSQFLVEFQSFIFGQILANFSSFGPIWADFSALVVADSMPALWLKS
jgi:hypothetical protein